MTEMFEPEREIANMQTKELVKFVVDCADAITTTEPGAVGTIALDDFKRKALQELERRRRASIPVTLIAPAVVGEPKRKRGRPRKVKA
jgi:hypothetical protein